MKFFKDSNIHYYRKNPKGLKKAIARLNKMLDKKYANQVVRVTETNNAYFVEHNQTKHLSDVYDKEKIIFSEYGGYLFYISDIIKQVEAKNEIW